MASDPKPQKRYRADSREWKDIHRAFRGSTCRLCPKPFESLHHIYPRGQGGDDVIVNLAPVCGSGTTGCHGRLEARDPATRAAMRDALTDANRWYLTWKLGHGAEAWLDRAYPAAVAA